MEPDSSLIILNAKSSSQLIICLLPIKNNSVKDPPQQAAHWASGATGLSAQRLVAEETKFEKDLGQESFVLISPNQGHATKTLANQVVTLTRERKTKIFHFQCVMEQRNGRAGVSAQKLVVEGNPLENGLSTSPGVAAPANMRL